MKNRNVFCIYLVLFFCLILSVPGIAQRQGSESGEVEYLAVFMEGKKVGYNIQSRIVEDGKVTTTEKFNITMSRAGEPVTMDALETSIESTKGEPLGFESVQQFGVMTVKVAGVVDKQGKVQLTVTSMGSAQKNEMQWPSGAMMSEGLRMLMMKKGLKQGTEYTARVFSPGIQQAIDAEIKVGQKQKVDLLGRVAGLTEVTSRYSLPGAGEIVSTSYVDDEFRAQKTIMPVVGIQVEMIACAKDFALGENDVFEFVNRMFLDSPEPLKDVQSAKSITYHLSPTDSTKNLVIPSGDSQKVQQLENGKLIVTIEPIEAPAGVKFPYKGGDSAILEAMKPTRFVQSDSKDIIELARKAIGNTNDAAEAARRIEAFVAKYIKSFDLSVGYATAVETATSKQGDCTEFAVLTAALCRAVGIPSKVVSGVAYVDDWRGYQGFGGHAWAQAYVGDKWIDLDAAFKGSGLGGYDAGHIALAIGNGNPEGFFNLATTVGQFKIDKVVINKD